VMHASPFGLIAGARSLATLQSDRQPWRQWRSRAKQFSPWNKTLCPTHLGTASRSAILARALLRGEASRMDKDKLAALRAKYAHAKGGDIHDPAFAEVASRVFATPDRRKWPFADPATLLGARFASDAAATGFAGLDVALVGVPMDLGVTNRAGARLGPRAVRSVERIGPYEHVLRVAPTGQLEVADVGDVPMKSRFSLDECHADIEAFYGDIARVGVTPLSVGGDHSITLPILKALGRDRPLGMVHIDAHCDTAGEYEGAKFHHGGPFRLAVLDGVLDPARVVQIGIRGGAEYLWVFSFERGMTVIHTEEVGE